MPLKFLRHGFKPLMVAATVARIPMDHASTSLQLVDLLAATTIPPNRAVGIFEIFVALRIVPQLSETCQVPAGDVVKQQCIEFEGLGYFAFALRK